ncbi:MAG: hypothetical protein EXR77_14175 [Myxococcales bacterium]|nr:hypothetical protein [Myxococcales bacterium]
MMTTTHYGATLPSEPSAVVAFGGPGPRTVAELWRDARAVAAGLPRATVGSHIAVICADRYWFAVALLASWQRQHAVALPPSGQPASVQRVTDRPEVLALLHDIDGGHGLDVRTLAAQRPDAPNQINLSGPTPPLELKFSADQVVATLFTSGSTGEPQACTKNARQLLGEVALWVAHLQLPVNTPFVATVPPHHLYGLLFSVLVPLAVGGRFGRTTPVHAGSVCALLAAQPQAVVISVPAHWRAVADLPCGALTNVRLALSSTAPLQRATAEGIEQTHHLSILELFGSTETGGIATRRQLADTLWQPLPSIAVSCSPTGQLRVRSPLTVCGVADDFETADRAIVEPDGRFAHQGRLDGVIKTGGLRVSVAHVEELLLAIAGVDDAAVIAVESAQVARGQELWAAVVAPLLTVDDLRAALALHLEPSTLPRRFVLAPALPRSDTGKLAIDEVRSLFGAVWQFEVLSRHETPTTCDIEVRPPPALFYFRGHFADHPVVPGIAQIVVLVGGEVRRLHPNWGAIRQLSRLKFRRVIAPNQVIALRLTFWATVGTVDFTLHRTGELCACGRLGFAVPTAAEAQA